MDLHLNLKFEYFDAIRDGRKPFEYRLNNEHWRKRLIGRKYDNVIFKRGYPKKGDTKNQIVTPYRGYEMQSLTHKHFGDNPVTVFAIPTHDSEKA